MKFQKIRIKNFLALGGDTSEVELADRGLVSIVGINVNETSANSNGAGKSSIADALCWCLFGTTARGATGDAVVNRFSKKDCVVEVDLEDEGTTYLIRRARKHTEYKNSLQVFKDEKIDLTKSSSAETEKVVTQILGCSYDVFVASIYSAQEKMPDLPMMTDKYLKLLIEEAAGLDKLGKAECTAIANLKLAEVQKTRIESKIERHYNFIDANKSVLMGLIEKRKEEEIWRKDQLEITQKEIVSLNQQFLDNSRQLLSDEEVEANEAKMAELKEVLDNYGTLEKEVRTKEQEAQKLKSDYEYQVSQLKRDVEDTKSVGAELKAVNDKVGTPCAECGKIYTTDDIAKARDILSDKIAKGKMVIDVKKNKLLKLKETVLSSLKEAEKWRNNLPSISDATEKYTEVKEVLNRNQALKSENEKIERRSKELCEKLKEYSKGSSALTKSIEDLEAEMKKAGSEIDRLNVKLQEKEEVLKVKRAVCDLYSASGIRAFIIDTVTPFLNERTAYYLNILSDGEMTATWQTLIKNKSGDVKEKFSIQVSSVNGAESFAGLSGGEKRKVRVATSMALQDLVASRASKPINLFIADEVDHALDASGLERLMTILSEKARLFGTALVISHNSLKDWISTTITVQKEDGISRII